MDWSDPLERVAVMPRLFARVRLIYVCLSVVTYRWCYVYLFPLIKVCRLIIPPADSLAVSISVAPDSTFLVTESLTFRLVLRGRRLVWGGRGDRPAYTRLAASIGDLAVTRSPSKGGIGGKRV